MHQRAIISNPSLAVGFALSSFAASVVKDEERKRNRLRISAAAAARKGADRGDGGEGGGLGEDSAAEGSSNRIEKRKRPLAGHDAANTDRLRGALWIEPEAVSSLNRDNSGDDGGAEVLQDWTLPTDTLVALKMMCQQFPKFDQLAVRPFVLRSQLYSSVSDRTIADRELEELKQQHVVRVFKLSSGKDDFAVMLMEDYLKQIEEEKKQMDMKRPEEETCIFKWFATHVVTGNIGVSIGHSHLVLLLSQAGKVNEKQISLLINSGLLVRQIADDTTYWFGIPNVGILLKSLSGGRKELQSFLSRRRYKEMIQAALEKRRLRFSKFNMRFHIRDLIGSGHLYSIYTPVGPLIRLARD